MRLNHMHPQSDLMPFIYCPFFICFFKLKCQFFPVLPFLLRKKNFRTCLNQIHQIYILNPDHQIDQIHCFDIQMLHVLCFSLLLAVCVDAASVQPPGIIKCSLKCLKCLIPLGAQFLYLLLNTVPTNSLFMCASVHTHTHTGTRLIILGTARRAVFSPDSPG